MDFYNLAGYPHKSSNVVSFRNTLVLFDCPLDLLTCLGFMPLSVIHNQQLSNLPHWRPPKEKLKEANFTYKESRIINYELKECHANHHCVDSSPEFAMLDTNVVDMQRVDVVLISNYLNMFALPYLTERLGFSGVIYCTEPTYHFGRIMMEELIHLIERTPKPRKAHLWKKVGSLANLPLPKFHKANLNPNSWLQIYSMKELNSCFSKIKLVSFGQTVDIFGLFEASAHSSGFCIGSCNWVLKSTFEKIVYMSQTSLLTTHPRAFDPTPLQKADVMLLTNLTSSPPINPDAMLSEFCSNTINALKANGNVLVPCYPCGTIYDLIECIAGQLVSANLTQVSLYFLSPVADSSLAYSNILGEWLTTTKQSRIYTPEEPFIHGSLVKAGKLKHFTGVSDPNFNDSFKSPCIVFTSHPSLRFGDAVHFIQLWGQSNRNLLILTEPDFPWQEAINPYLPLPMRVLYIPIDTNWNFKQANNLLNTDLKPSNLILHQDYNKLPASYTPNSSQKPEDLKIEIHNSTPSPVTTITGTPSNPTSIIGAIGGCHKQPVHMTVDTPGVINVGAKQHQIQQQIQMQQQQQQQDTMLGLKSHKSCETHTYPYLGSLSLTCHKSIYERVLLDARLAAQIIQKEIRPGVCLAMVNGSLVAKNNKYTLLPIDNK